MSNILARDLTGAEHGICVTDLSAVVVIQNGRDHDAATRIYNIDNALELAHQLTEACARLRRPQEPDEEDQPTGPSSPA